MSAEICGPDELWVPGKSLEQEYPTPTPEQLQQAWENYSGSMPHAFEGVFGVANPTDDVVGIASIDICEVLRETSTSLDKAIGSEPRRRSMYKVGTWLEHVDADFEFKTITSIVQATMNAGLVEATPEAVTIAPLIRSWRQKGILCLANTSTLPGCEIATIEHTLKEYMPGCFDGIVFPRNHDGNGKLTKAEAVEIAASELGFDHTVVPLVHIDDSIHHVEGFMKHYNDHDKAAYFVPLHADNQHAEKDHHCETPYEAFERADEFFAKTL